MSNRVRLLFKARKYVVRPLAAFTLAVARWLRDFAEQVREVSRERHSRP